ncbi:MAG: thiamine pyrophosphate-binding protein [Betaproteobacteria bacterium]|nr:thiamine pyrophosphate-binding protein [Betaproteobacteria bacterium]
METITGNELVGESLKRIGVKNFFFIMGGPINDTLLATMRRGIRGIDVRHEQAAAMAAQSYARALNFPGVCFGASGPGTINLTTGLANALIDGVPVVGFGGSSPIGEYGNGAFQEIDQVAIMKPVTKWANRVYETRRLPEYIDLAFRTAVSGKPGPVYLDLPSDVINNTIDDSTVVWPDFSKTLVRARPQGDPALIEDAIKILEKAERPVILSGSGVLWSGAEVELREFVVSKGIPIYTTPQGRGVLEEDHPQAFLNARSSAMKETDCVMIVGTRLNFVFGHVKPPRISANAKIIRIDVDPGEISNTPRADVAILGDAKAVIKQLLDAGGTRIKAAQYAGWRGRLSEIERLKGPESEKAMSTAATPIHPLRLCKEIRDFIDRDGVLVVDGQEILNFGRQSIPTFFARHRINSGTFGTMGVGMPFGVGAKVARPDKQVIVLHGDGSFGLNSMELDTAARHNIPVIVVISLNGGWTADPKGDKPGRNLGYTRFDLFAQSLGCHGEQVDKPEDIRPALERAKEAIKNGKPALVNVVTDHTARATTIRFTKTAT